MFDQMTRPLQQVTQALNLTISAMDNMNNSANRDIRITNSLSTAREAIQRAGAGFALKEAPGGDFMSLKGRFGFGSADREILQSAESMKDFISKFNAGVTRI